MGKSSYIKAGGLFASHFLEVSFLGIRYQAPQAISFGASRCGFDKISCALMSPTNVLSLQIDKTVFSIPTNPNDPKHQKALAELMDGLNRSANSTYLTPTSHG